jgi:hypothetical protein
VPPENLVDPKLADARPPAPPVVDDAENEPPAARTPVAVEVGAVFAVGLSQVDPPLELNAPVPIEVNICWFGLRVKNPSALTVLAYAPPPPPALKEPLAPPAPTISTVHGAPKSLGSAEVVPDVMK